MILNVSKIKTQALLLFCKDLILTYKNNKEISIDRDNYKLNNEINKITDEILRELIRLVGDNEYYLKNKSNYRIKAVLQGYNFINEELSKNLKKDDVINPAMLYFSFLTLWFKELDKESRSKEFIYFTIYPYSKIYDKMFIEIKDKKFRAINIKMIELAEKIIRNYDLLSLKQI